MILRQFDHSGAFPQVFEDVNFSLTSKLLGMIRKKFLVAGSIVFISFMFEVGRQE